MIRTVLVLTAFTLGINTAYSEVRFMDEIYTKKFCDLWNETPELVNDLADWSKDTNGKDYRVIRFYRQDCGGVEKAVELHISHKDGKAVCIYGGKATDVKPDFLMYATDKNWNSLANGEFGVFGMGIMSKMSFEGSKWEAMQNMGAFKSFLLNLKKIDHTMDCP
ncbi:SCP2 sterol-binding domain-containing protein [Persephonella sp.]